MCISQLEMLLLSAKKPATLDAEVDVSRVRVINIKKNTFSQEKSASIVSSPRYTVSSLLRCSVKSVQDEVEDVVPSR